jgi:glycosyltransferase involved in cell wall biosynthesis
LQGVAVDLADPAAAAARVAALLDRPVPDHAAMARWAAARYSWEAMAREVLSAAR